MQNLAMLVCFESLYKSSFSTAATLNWVGFNGQNTPAGIPGLQLPRAPFSRQGRASVPRLSQWEQERGVPLPWDWRKNLPLRSPRIRLNEACALRLLAAASRQEELRCNHADRFERLGRLLKPPRGGREAGASSAGPLRVGGNRGARPSAYTDPGKRGRRGGLQSCVAFLPLQKKKRKKKRDASFSSFGGRKLGAPTPPPHFFPPLPRISTHVFSICNGAARRFQIQSAKALQLFVCVCVWGAP